MKTKLKILGIAALVLFALTFAACKGSIDDDLVGKWYDSAAKNYEVYEFKSDGTLIQNGYDAGSLNATFTTKNGVITTTWSFGGYSVDGTANYKIDGDKLTISGATDDCEVWNGTYFK